MVGLEGHKWYKGLGPKQACFDQGLQDPQEENEESFVVVAPALDPAAAPGVLPPPWQSTGSGHQQRLLPFILYALRQYYAFMLAV